MTKQARIGRAPVSLLLRVAYHEAGHAVAAFHLGRSIRTVTILPGADFLGLTTHWRTPSFRPDIDTATPRMRARLEDEIVILLAGSIAEKHFTGRRNHLGAGSDFGAAGGLALYRVESDRSANALLRWLGVMAEDFVHFHWPEIEDVAKVLMEKKTLRGREVRAVILARAH